MVDADLQSGTWVDATGSAAARVRKVRLEVLDGPDQGASTVVSSPVIVIGRDGGDLRLTDRKVSSLHVEIALEERGYRLRDLGSTNGTFAWGMRLVEAFVAPGTVLSIGDSVVRFEPLPESVELPMSTRTRLEGLVGATPPMRRLYAAIERAAAGDVTVLVTGETGTGKELVAEALHRTSARRDGPFVVLDCGAIPSSLFEDQLFGHEPGAFTGATGARRGAFEQAHGGTLFLDELGELPLDVQAKLLRAVETRAVRRLGGSETIACDCRLVAATNRDLRAEVNRKAFRADLFFRFAVVQLSLAPLRERRDDIPVLVAHFVAELGLAPDALPAGFAEWARNHPWPGNVRELRNAIERAAYLEALPPGEPATSDATATAIDTSIPFKEAKARLVDDFDRRYITALLEEHDWKIAAAARAARLDRMSIYKLLRRLGIERDVEA